MDNQIDNRIDNQIENEIDNQIDHEKTNQTHNQTHNHTNGAKDFIRKLKNQTRPSIFHAAGPPETCRLHLPHPTVDISIIQYHLNPTR